MMTDDLKNGNEFAFFSWVLLLTILLNPSKIKENKLCCLKLLPLEDYLGGPSFHFNPLKLSDSTHTKTCLIVNTILFSTLITLNNYLISILND